ncbi:uncharacterized protein PG986_009782 [Apiospora aurea]|uniref:Uncharacterized protein n=1 Tax=Apiospora aurea TaxID=335848 RepID=A0ABR1Q9X9_9PEZI
MPPRIEDRCYGTCNAAFIKGQVSRDWEDFCVTGSAFYDYYNYCLCCVSQDLRAKGSDERAADYLAADFAGILSQCGSDDDNPYHRDADPCSVPKHDVSNKVETPFPTATVHVIHPSADSLSVGVPITLPLHQLRPGQEAAAAAPTSMPPRYTPIEHETTAWVTTTDANSQVTKVMSTFLTTTMSLLPALDTPQPSSTDNTTPASGNNKQGLTVAQVAGISVACTVVFLLLCSGLLYWLHGRRKSRKEAQARLPGIGQWEELNNNHPTTQEEEEGVGGFEKAQLHADPIPTRELGGREIPRPPVELPAEPVSKDSDGPGKEET